MRVVPVIAGCALVAVAVAGCSSSVVCATPLDPALRITVADSITNMRPAAASVLTVQDGDFHEVQSDSTAQGDQPFTFDAAIGRPGTYTATISTPGYHDWSATRVVVHGGTCGVQTVPLTARLVRAD